MLKQQQTIKRRVILGHWHPHGIQRHDDVEPAPVDHGIKFVRVDLDSKPEIEPHIRNIGDTTRWTTIGTNGTVIHTVEHVLATLNGYGIDNLIIELDANEPPVGDGSALPYVKLVKQAASSRRKASARSFGRRKRYTSRWATRWRWWCRATRCGSVARSITASRTGCAVPEPRHRAGHVETQISPARTFALYEEVQYLIDHGLIKGGSLENAVLIRNETILATEPLRFRDEFVRHKILDVLGDIVLLGRPLAAHIITIRARPFL